MRRNLFHAIRKQLCRRHRNIGVSECAVPCMDENLTRLLIYGNTVYGSECEHLASVGIYRYDLQYEIPISYRGTNLLDYRLLFDNLIERLNANVRNTGNDYVTCIYTEPVADVPIVTSEDIPFEENTAYTFVGTYEFSTTLLTDTGFSFLYTDGSCDKILLPEKASVHKYFAASSNPEKTLSAIAAGSPERRRTYKYLKRDFGLFKGAFTDGAAVFSDYTEPGVITVETQTPLRSLGDTHDTIDIATGMHNRRLQYFTANGPTTVITVYEGLFAIPLDSSVRPDMNIKCNYHIVSYEEIMNGTYGVAVPPDMWFLYIRLSNVKTPEELWEAFSRRPIHFTYAIGEYTEIKFINVKRDYGPSRIFTVNTEAPPHRMICEYIEKG